MNKKAIQSDVLTWYDENQRILPWRDNKNPYFIWISEIMLQQTKVQTVIPYFERFIKEVPSIKALAELDEDRLLKLWEGLGYYNRAKNLQKAAKEIISNHEGVFPATKEKLESLSGIGPYTSGAIASIAFNKKYSAVDGNVLRVFSRLLEIEEDIKEKNIKSKIKDFVDSVLPNDRIGDFNQGLMEIGATVCLPNGAPICVLCPFNEYCGAYQHGKTKTIPKKRKKKAVPIEEKTVLILKYKNKYGIEKRPDKGLLASMYQFPMLQGTLTLEEIEKRYSTVSNHIVVSDKTTHKFSHKQWNMVGYIIELNEELGEYIYVTYQELDETYTVPTAFKIYKKVIKGGTNE